MSAIQTGVLTIERSGRDDALASVIEGLLLHPAQRAGRAACVQHSLSCVWSDAACGWSCASRIPKAVVTNAWRRELEAGAAREDRFFHFIWRGGVWLAYGLKDGRVRGVYCPSHNSERAERSHAAICGAGEIAFELPLAA